MDSKILLIGFGIYETTPEHTSHTHWLFLEFVSELSWQPIYVLCVLKSSTVQPT